MQIQWHLPSNMCDSDTYDYRQEQHNHMQISLKYYISTKILYMNTRVKCTIPKSTVVPDNSFVNFISLAESVALAPIVVLWISFDMFSLPAVKEFVWLADEIAFVLLLFWSLS